MCSNRDKPTEVAAPCLERRGHGWAGLADILVSTGERCPLADRRGRVRSQKALTAKPRSTAPFRRPRETVTHLQAPSGSPVLPWALPYTGFGGMLITVLGNLYCCPHFTHAQTKTQNFELVLGHLKSLYLFITQRPSTHQVFVDRMRDLPESNPSWSPSLIPRADSTAPSCEWSLHTAFHGLGHQEANS